MLLIMQTNKRENMNVLCLQACGLAPKNGLHTFVNSLVDSGRQEGKCLCNLQQNMLFLNKSNSKCLSSVSVRRGQSNFSTVYIFC